MPRLYEKPLQPLSSWTDTASCHSDDVDDRNFSVTDRDLCRYDEEVQMNHPWDDSYFIDRDGEGSHGYYRRTNKGNRRNTILTLLVIVLSLILIVVTVLFSVNSAKQRSQPIGGPMDEIAITDQEDGDTSDSSVSSSGPKTQVPTFFPTAMTTMQDTTEPTLSLPIGDEAGNQSVTFSPTSAPISTAQAPVDSVPVTSAPSSVPPVTVMDEGSLTSAPTIRATVSTPAPMAVPTDAPTLPPPTDAPVESSAAVQQPSVNEVTVLYPGEHLAAGHFHTSPNGKYKAGLTDAGNFVLMNVEVDQVIWSTGTNGAGVRVYLQPDGNLLLRSAQKSSLWSSETHGYTGAQLKLSDGGQIAIKTEDGKTAIWMDGIPRSIYRGPSSSSQELSYPVRGAFYYPWYPQTWTVNGAQAKYNAALGEYSSSDPRVAVSHINSMDYAHIDLSIASWWGPDTNLDKARMTMLMDETIAMGSPLKWSVYHEDERDLNPSVEEIQSDLRYLKEWFAWHEAWAHKDGKPVIFVYNEAGCDVARRWTEASNGEWYVVLKLFKGFMGCSHQPESWHQYGVGEGGSEGPIGTIHNSGNSFVLSPGFWRADKEVPLVPRVNKDTFCKNTQLMVESGEPWQLIVSFNEAGEGTMIENSPQWPSDSGYGQYLDCLHDNV